MPAEAHPSVNASPAMFAKPSWLERLPKRADALCVAAAIDRNVPVSQWGAAVRQAQDAGFEVDASYLRDRRTILRGVSP